MEPLSSKPRFEKTINMGCPSHEFSTNSEYDGRADEDSRGKKRQSYEDRFIGILESVCSMFDNVYLARSLGIISDKNILYRYLNKGDWGSKLWFVTLILSARKSMRQLFRTIRAKRALQCEIESTKLNSRSLVNDVLYEKLNDNLNKCASVIKDAMFDLLQTLVYLKIVVIDLFKIAVPKKWKRILEPLSNFITLTRFFTIAQSASRDQ